MKLAVLFGVLLNGFSICCFSETINVGMEPFPPFVNEEKQGFTVDMFRAIEKISDLKFNIEIMTYARAKHELKYQKIDIAGHTPKKLETQDFYQYGEELNWQIDTTSDLFSFDPHYFEFNNIAHGRIGTTLGNADFFAQQMGLSRDKFIETSSMNQLIDMFIKRRIDVLVFERVSVMTLLQDRNVNGVFYQTIGKVPASIAVFKGEAGSQLKAKLDGLISQLDHDQLFGDYFKYTKLPKSGKVPVITN
jgi:polar amino acid transport system substrate-binding protein